MGPAVAMRVGSVLFAAGVLLASPDFAIAQRRPAPPPPVSVPPPIAPMPGPASLDVPHPIPPMSPASGSPRDLYQQLTPAGPRDLYRQITPQRFPPPVFGVPGYGYGYGYTPGESAPSVVAPVARGALRLETTPGSAQVYVDGLFCSSTGSCG